MSASKQDGSYPRPQLCRPHWGSLDGVWGFAHDDERVGVRDEWFAIDARDRFDRDITVPYPPESEASGIDDSGAHPVVWYRRDLDVADVPEHGLADRVLLHFGAVDYRAQVWVNGRHVADHVGGQTPFTADITEAIAASDTNGVCGGSTARHVVVVRAEDDPHDQSQPRGKQTWQDRPHKVWYERTSGIWQTVWLEAVPAVHIDELSWEAHPDDGVCASVQVRGAAHRRLLALVELELDEHPLTRAAATMTGNRLSVHVPMTELDNCIDREDLLWSPEHPVLLDAKVSLCDAETGAVIDEVTSYVGIRAVGVDRGCFLLNRRPYFVRAVLNQGYRATTHLANQGTDELRSEVALAKAMGFNCMRIHQKVEDPRILFWADRLGLLVWAEIGANYEYSPASVLQLTAEWLAAVQRDRSHPCVVTWVPFNESWGVPNLAQSPAQRQFVAGLAALTRALDPSRPVMTNEGWEHVNSDILGVHDYASDPVQLMDRYSDATELGAHLGEHGDAAAGRIIALTRTQIEKFRSGRAPLMLSEFGGLALDGLDDSFAYTYVTSSNELATKLHELFASVRAIRSLAGFCYTQLFDTAQEINGLADAQGRPKLPVASIRAIVTGEGDVGQRR